MKEPFQRGGESQGLGELRKFAREKQQYFQSGIIVKMLWYF